MNRRVTSLWTALLLAAAAGAGICVTTAGAQTLCASALERATVAYDEARFDSAVAILEPCVETLGAQRWQGYRLLALAHVFADRPADADAAVHRMLELNPRYVADDERDPIELRRIVSQYAVVPRLAIAALGGLSVTSRYVDDPRAVAQTAENGDDSELALGNDIGVGLRLAVTPNIGLDVGITVSERAFSLSRQMRSRARTEYTERLDYVTLPALVRLSLPLGSVQPYIGVGYFYQALVSATSDVTTWPADTLEAYSDLGVLSTEARRESSNHGLLFGAGFGVPLGDGLIALDGRFELGLADVVRDEKRFNDPEMLYRYLYVDDGFRLRNFILSISYAHPILFAASR